MNTEDRWYVRFRGHTLGPLTSEQVKSSVRRKELGPEDKLASTSNPAWRALRTQEEFLRCWESLHRPLPAELTPLPSPKILWQKKRAPLPAALQPATPKAAPVNTGAAAPTPAAPAQPEQKNKSAPRPAAAAKTKPKAKPARKSKTSRKPAKTKTQAAPEALADPAKTVALAEPETKPATSLIPAKPQITPPAEDAPAPVLKTEQVEARAPSPAPAAASPKLAEETLSLLEALRDWNRKEKENSAQTAPAPESPPRTAAQPAVPETAAPVSLTRPDPAEAVPAPAGKSGIELRLNLVISKQFIFIFTLVAALAAAAAIYTFSEAKKMRGPVDSRLPDPSSPTIEPSSENDPIPQLKAPTRPRRD